MRPHFTLLKLRVPFFPSLRAVALVTVVILRAAMTSDAYHAIFIAVLFGHYTMALIYSRSQAVALLRRPAAYHLLAVLFVIGAFTAYSSVPDIVLFFGLHHVLSDSLLPASTKEVAAGTAKTKTSRNLTISRMILNGFIYVQLLRTNPAFYFFPKSWILIGLILSVFVFLINLRLAAARNTDRQMIFDLLLFEAIGVSAAILMAPFSPKFYDVVFYHLIFWSLYPVCISWRGFKNISRPYIAGTAGITAATYFFTPISPVWHLALPFAKWDTWATTFGYFHITSSFGLSRLNPAWLVRRFYPKSTDLTKTGSPQIIFPLGSKE
jgi:hypothetical protein